MLVFLATLTLVLVSLQRTYSKVPLRELKYRARHGSELAGAFVKVVGYGHSLRTILWFMIGLSSAGFFVIVAQTSPTWYALVACGTLVWVGFVWIPTARVNFISEKIAGWCAPALAKLLQYLHPMIDKIVRIIHSHLPVRVHTGLYDRRDLIKLLEYQQGQNDNRIEKSDINIALHALTFGDKTIGAIMTPKRVVKTVSSQDTLGPILMDELYASGHSRFPVYEQKKDNIVGTLYLHDLLKHKHGSVGSLMREQVYYLREDQSLGDALQAVLTTHHHLFIVVNSFEEFVGVISSEDVLETIVGQPIMDEFDQYADLRAVAQRSAHQEQKDHEAQYTEI